MSEVDKVRGSNFPSCAVYRNFVLEKHESDCDSDSDAYPFASFNSPAAKGSQNRLRFMHNLNTPLVWLFPDMISSCSTTINDYWHSPLSGDVFEHRFAHGWTTNVTCQKKLPTWVDYHDPRIPYPSKPLGPLVLFLVPTWMIERRLIANQFAS